MRNIDAALGDNLSVSHNKNAICEQYGLIHVVGHKKDRRLVNFTQTAQQRVHLDSRQCVECAKGLIEEEQLGFSYERSSKRGALCLSAGECPRPSVFVSGEPNFLKRLATSIASISIVNPEHNVVKNAHPRKQTRVLKDDRSTIRDLEYSARLGIKSCERA
jgi:hypothetical protein